MEREEFLAGVAILGLNQAVNNGFFDNLGGASAEQVARIEAVEEKVATLDPQALSELDKRLSVLEGATPVTPVTKFGWFNYNNTIKPQSITGGEWTTINNDALGIETMTGYAPYGVGMMLDPSTGRILLSDLEVGDEVYIRHTVNVIPYTTSTTYEFSHYFGSGGSAYRLPVGVPTSLDEGGGIPTGDFLVDTHFFVKNDNARASGMLPQIRVSNDSKIEYTGCYISVTRR